MVKACKRHVKNPVMVYHQCAGCELEWLREKLEQKQQEIERLQQERDKLIEGLRLYANPRNWYGDVFAPPEGIPPEVDDGGQRARDILREVGVTVE